MTVDVRNILAFVESLTQDSAVLRERYAGLQQQIPLMHLLMAINVVFLADRHEP